MSNLVTGTPRGSDRSQKTRARLQLPQEELLRIQTSAGGQGGWNWSFKRKGWAFRELTDEEGKPFESSVIPFLSHFSHFILELILLALLAQNAQNPTSYHHLHSSLHAATTRTQIIAIAS